MALMLGMASCNGQVSTTTSPAGVTTTVTTNKNPIAALNAFTQADLQNAINIAQQAGPNGAQIVTCFTWLQAQLAAIQNAQPQPGSTTGVATIFTVADLGVANLNGVLSPTAQMGYETACGPLVLHVQNQGLSLAAQIQVLGALLAK